MTELLTAAQMRAIEQAAIESGEVTGLELMERAGRGVVEAIFEEWPELAKTSHRAVVLCGPGNNGGDGFVVARLLKEWGWEVEVYLYGDPENLPPDAKMNYERWIRIGRIQDLSSESDEAARCLMRPVEVVIDALFGTGLKRPLPEELGASLRNAQILNDGRRIVSVDIPSGLCADSGKIVRRTGVSLDEPPFPSEAICAFLTVTFHRAKNGHYLARGGDFSGNVFVKSIGLEEDGPLSDIERALNETVAPTAERVRLEQHAYAAKHSQSHKYSNGHVLILSGGPGKTGAARLAARGALRIGAGLVTLGVPPSAQMEVASQITAIMLKRVEDGEALSEVLEDQRLNAMCVGPGLGSGDREKALILAALKAKRPTVLDADALSILFFDEADALFDKLHDRCVLTPHGGEFARMFPDIAEKLNATPTKGPAYSKVDAAREAAKQAGCVVLFKGPDTVIAHPDGRCSINSAHCDRAAPWLATAGSGDVLAGFITGLLARGFDAMTAAETAAWLHVECALSFGPGLIAEDLPEELPKIFRDLGL